MKRIMVMSFSFLLGLSVMAFAMPDKKDMEKMQKQQKEMTQLVEKYNKATSDKKKAEIKEKIQAKVAANYDKHIERMEERIKESEQKLAEAKAKLAESKTPEFKAKHIEEITQNIISGEMKPMFGVPPADFKGDKKGMKWDKKHHKGCPCMKGNKDKKPCPCMKGEDKGCPFAKADGKGCPCMKGNRDEKSCPCMKGKDCPCKKGPVDEITPVKPKLEEK